MKSNKVKYLLATATVGMVLFGTGNAKADEVVVEGSSDGIVSDGYSELIINFDEPATTDVVYEPAPETPSLEEVIVETPVDSGSDVVVDLPTLDDVVVETPAVDTAPSIEDVVVDNGGSQSDNSGSTGTIEVIVPSETAETDKTDEQTTAGESTEEVPTTTETETTPQPTQTVVIGGETVENTQTSEQARNEGNSQVGTYSESAKAIVSDVSEEKPVETATGYTIVSTENSDVIVATADGSQIRVSAETVGAKVNEDGTVSVKTKTGKIEVLPESGDKTTILSLLGIYALGFIGYRKAKQKYYFN